MSSEKSILERFETIKLPAVDLPSLSFCAGNKVSHLQTWLDSLPATQIMQSGSRLYQATPELSRLKVDTKTRLALLEVIRPSVQNCISGLSKHFLHQPLVLPKDAQKVAIVAQSLQKNMADGYTRCVGDLIRKGKLNGAGLEHLSMALQRALNAISFIILRANQLYSSAPPGLWRRAHTLYAIACHYDIAKTSVNDECLTFSLGQTPHAAYSRLLMLSTSKCNQLGQKDMAIAFESFEDWAKYLAFKPSTAESEQLFVVDLDGDTPPKYKSKTNKISGHILEVDFSGVLKNMPDDYEKSNDVISSTSTLKTPIEFPEALFQHFIDCWSTLAERQQNRREIQSSAEICVGLVDVHYYLCNGQDFSYYVRNASESDAYAPASRFTPKDINQKPQVSKGDRPVHEVTIQNVSAGGYCMLWRGDMPAKVESGELLGIKEMGRRTWSIGVVRWIKQLKNASQIGVQLLTTTPRPYAVAQAYDTGGAHDFSRAIYIPSSRFGNPTTSIILPSVPFHEFDKVQVLDGDNEWSAKIEKLIFSSGGLRQYIFRPLANGSETQDEPIDFGNTEINESWE